MIKKSYLRNIWDTCWTIFDGMAVTARTSCASR
jgi:hypothetical protein